ncbi:MAG: hypothetical protein ACLR8Y_18840 [Alistipes indistinctus]
MQFSTKNNTIVSIRPSGTEPKIKYYFGICEKLPSKRTIPRCRTAETGQTTKELETELNLD